MPTIIHLMRHGEVHNPGRVLYGRLPGYRLSERGEEMARTVAAYLAGSEVGDAGRDVAAVIASPLERAQQTAAPVARVFGLSVGVDDRLIEAGNRFEGTTIGAQPWRLLNPRRWPLLVNPTRPSWGEPYRDQVARMQAAVSAARTEFAGHEVVLVSHQLPIWVTRLAFEGNRLWHDPRRRQCALASLTSLTFDGDRLIEIEYRQPAGHLLDHPTPGGAWGKWPVP
jgi:broad specificity phosphatase PhoE